LTTYQRLAAFSELRNRILNQREPLDEIISAAHQRNSWFTPENIRQAIFANLNLLDQTNLEEWVSPYLAELSEETDKNVGLILAGNIPMVGFHDILTCLIAGFKVQIKTSSDDRVLIPYLLDQLIMIEPEFASKIKIVDKLSNFDLVIATGSNNTSRYFDYYFRNVPHVIRKNRNGVSIITSAESKEDFQKLGKDIFDYFGLGCRNVSKIFFPTDFDYSSFFEAIEGFSDISNHYKYNNNYEYNKAIYLVNGDEHLDNGFLLLKRDERIASPLGVVYIEEYQDIENVKERLVSDSKNIQCLVGNISLEGTVTTVPFGKSQEPKLSDYADGINILEFLNANR